jgi:hypothetical protein
VLSNQYSLRDYIDESVSFRATVILAVETKERLLV